MEVMHHVHDNQHEQLSREYDDLIDPCRTDSILQLLDKDSFCAKQILSSLIMVGVLLSYTLVLRLELQYRMPTITAKNIYFNTSMRSWISSM